MAVFPFVLVAACCTTVASTALDAYLTFRMSHRDGLGQDSVRFAERHAIFERRRAEVEHHNLQNRSWKAAVNRFADLTDDERLQHFGFKRAGGLPKATVVSPSFLEVRASLEFLREASDWQALTPLSSQLLRDQGHCGSCWAVAAVSAIEMHAEVQTGKVSQLSAEQIIDCAPNPNHCGGTGGCKGATSTLAMEYVKQHGLALQDEYPIDGRDDVCFEDSAPKVARISGWTQLPPNHVEPLMRVLATKGPAVVSVEGRSWFDYNSGVFAGCSKDAIIGHSVILVGYGLDADSGLKYWRIRNSWGPDWGEGGYMRLLRHADEREHCGTDDEPQQGFGCDGGPEEIEVCGMCGILSHPSHPDDVTIGV